MKLCAIEPEELEEKILIRFIENQNDELLEDLSDYVINSQKEIERLNKQLQLISDEFLKYDWENSSKEQIINQLKSLYNSIFKGVS